MNLDIFEQKHERLASIPVFLWRVATWFGLSAILVFSALAIGVAGYHWIAGFAWVDSLLEASMILGGMGPITQLPSDAAKIFASAYALFSGLVFVGGMSIVLAPIVHRMLHRFHVDQSDIEN